MESIGNNSDRAAQILGKDGQTPPFEFWNVSSADAVCAAFDVLKRSGFKAAEAECLIQSLWNAAASEYGD